MTRAAWESPPDSAFSGPALIRLQMRQALNRCPGPRSICHIGNIAIVNVWRIFVGNLPSISVLELFYRFGDWPRILNGYGREAVALSKKVTMSPMVIIT